MAIDYSLLLEDFSSVISVRIASPAGSCRVVSIPSGAMEMHCVRSEEIETRMQALDSAASPVPAVGGSQQAVW